TSLSHIIQDWTTWEDSSSLDCLVKVLDHLGEDFLHSTLSLDPGQFALLLVVGHDGSSRLVERLQTQLDSVHIVVGASTGLCTLEQSFHEGLLRYFEEDGQLGGHDLSLELVSLGDLSRVSIDEESLTSLGNFLEHRLLDQIE
ncbi:hypothetical protein PMAYCL1PPCAC_02796, partial [Pristionchus mayeri]